MVFERRKDRDELGKLKNRGYKVVEVNPKQEGSTKEKAA